MAKWYAASFKIMKRLQWRRLFTSIKVLKPRMISLSEFMADGYLKATLNYLKAQTISEN